MHIAIIGSGLSGTICAINLLMQDNPCTITIFEKSNTQWLKGAAYSSALPHQLLNVPATAMSLFEHQPNHFWEWLEQHGYGDTYQPHDFVPRNLYGEYITETFNQAKANSPNDIHTIFQAVTDIQQVADSFMLTTADYQEVAADVVLLCNGNLPAQDPPGITEAARRHAQYAATGWTGNYLPQVGRQDAILIIGTGLTMVDQVLSLHKMGHQGKIYLTSRRGFLPLPHGHAPDYSLSHLENADLTTALGTLRWIRAEVKTATAMGATWISVFNAIRELTPRLWEQWNVAERNRFLRHIKPYWEVHRHRIPPSSAQIIDQLIANGQVSIMPGRLQQIDRTTSGFEATLIAKGSREKQTIQADWICNCTGPHANIRKAGDTLIDNLLDKGLLTTDPLGLGLVATAEAPHLFVIGPPSKGTYWECTALREIRRHATAAVRMLTDTVHI